MRRREARTSQPMPCSTSPLPQTTVPLFQPAVAPFITDRGGSGNCPKWPVSSVIERTRQRWRAFTFGPPQERGGPGCESSVACAEVRLLSLRVVIRSGSFVSSRSAHRAVRPCARRRSPRFIPARPHGSPRYSLTGPTADRVALDGPDEGFDVARVNANYPAATKGRERARREPPPDFGAADIRRAATPRGRRNRPVVSAVATHALSAPSDHARDDSPDVSRSS
jgi:hypothetical protein